jgi:photosystem II stability/assembly factor-like uncharacterized protein/PKD repeat protein
MFRPLLWALVVVAGAAPLTAQPWYDLMKGPRPNLFEVTKAYDAWYAAHPFVKNGQTQEYKRWVRHMELYADEHGYERRPAWTQTDDARFMSAQRITKSERTQAPAQWKGLGPFAWDKKAAGLSYAPGLAHCYVVREDPRDPAVIWAGTATAGVWKSVDSAKTWTNVTHAMMVREVRALCIDADRSGTAWFGASTGIWKTVDGGATWSPTSVTSAFFSDFDVNDIVQVVGRPGVILASTSQGLLRSTDGGSTFTTVQQGTFLEIEQHPTSPDIIYAVKRSGEGCAFLKSRNAGATFEIAGNGLPIPNTTKSEHTRRWEIAVSPAAPARVYLLAAGVMNGGEGLVGVYISSDEGATFSMRCCGDGPGGAFSPTNPNLLAWQPDGQEKGGQYYYDLALDVSDTDPDRIYVGGINVWVSSDGGRTFTCNAKWTYEQQYRRRYTHADIHDIVTIGKRTWVASDGGVFRSLVDMDSVEDRTSGIQGTEFWGWDAGFTNCDVMLGGTYHNGVLMKDGNTYNGWLHIYGGDNAGGLVNFANDRVVYADRYYGQPWDRITLSGDARIAPVKQDMGIAPTSNVAMNPLCNTEMWAGTSRGFMRSTDHGRSWDTIAPFTDSTVRRIRIAERHSNTMVILTKAGTYGTVNIKRSDDAGKTFTTITPPSGLSGGNGWRVNDIAIDDEDPDTMWITLGGLRTGAKVLRTTDGGKTWTDYTGGLPEPAVNCIVHQRGSNGLVYVGTQLGVYVRDNAMADWELYGQNLPVSHVTAFDICYREGLLRIGSNRGVFEVPVKTASAPQALAAVEQRVYLCTRDTVVFHDHSVADAASVRRTWTFEGGTPTTSTSEHPRVTYSSPGSYRVRLVVEDVSGISEHVVDSLVTIMSTCNPDDLPESALACNGTDASAMMKPLNRPLSSATVTAWIRTQGSQNDFAGIVFSRGGGTVAGLSIMANNTLRYHWADRGWNNVPTLKVPESTWTHVALVVTPTTTTIYVNGVGQTFETTNAEQTFAGDVHIGRDPTSVLRHFRGLIDEVRIYERALTQRELREMMHRTNASVTGLVAYYQFNEQGRAVIDRFGDQHGWMTPTAVRQASTAPVGRGSAMTLPVTTATKHAWTDLGLSIQWSGSATPPAGDVVVTRLREADLSSLTSIQRTIPNSLFIVNSYGTTQFSRPDAIDVDDVRIQDNEAARPADLVVFARPWHGDAPWDTPVGIARNAVAGPKGRVSFEGGTFFTSSSQLVVGSRQTVGVSVADTEPSTYRLAPNPIVDVLTITVQAPSVVEVFDTMGRLHDRMDVEQQGRIDMRGYAAGTYLLRVTTGTATRADVIVKQ